MARPVILSVQVGMPREIPFEPAHQGMPGPRGSTWHTAFFKEPVRGPVHVGRITVAGDGQANLQVHGGEDRPVLAYNGDHYPRWQNELGYTDMPYGGFGENFTISGMGEREVCLGDRYSIGSIQVEVSQPRQPCWKLARRWQNKDLPALVIKHNRGGWYFRVLQEGPVEAGMPVELLERPYPQWTIARAMEVFYHGKDQIDAMRALAKLPPLSEQWRTHFEKVVEAKSQPD
jgi:MOSC domain-containing protein YiiM